MTAQQILAAHVTQAPEPLTNRRAACPPPLAALVMKCLEKRPADRWQSAGDLASQLEWLAASSVSAAVPAPATLQLLAGAPVYAGVQKAEADRPAAAKLISTVASRFRDELGYEKTLASFSWVKWTDLGDNVTFFGLDGQPPAFDRVYNNADAIWMNYPQAQIKDRFAPLTLRDDRAVRRIWEAAGKKAPVRKETYESAVAQTGSPIFTKPVTINFRSDEADLDPQSMAVVNHQLLPQVQIARGMLIRIEGNTDSVGEADWNKKLSKRRAQAIADYLVSRGVDPTRIVARGNGAGRPIASNRTADGRARNRRTDILFIPAGRAQL